MNKSTPYKLDNRIKYVFMLMALISAFAIGNITGSTTVVQEAPEEEPALTEKKEKPEEKLEPINIDLSGNSNTATDKFKLRKGLATFKMTYSGDSNFIVALLNSNGETVESLVNEIGNFDGSMALNIEEDGEYILNLERAMGAWSITIKQ